MKFGFIAKHRGIWPVRWLCGALGVSRSGFHGWLTRPKSAHSRADEALATKVRASFVASDRTYGADLPLNFHPATIRASAGVTPCGAGGATCDRRS
jgi:hypothetical protein